MEENIVTKPQSAVTAVATVGAGRDSQGRFLTGNSGPGRPKGSRNRLTDIVMATIAADFAENGADVIAAIRKTDPATYLKFVASFVPRELVVQREREPAVDIENLSAVEFIELVETLERQSELRRTLLDAQRI
jgi:hypothetical protein